MYVINNPLPLAGTISFVNIKSYEPFTNLYASSDIFI